MKMLSLEIRNFCQHLHRDITFGDGLTAIIGANGSGKSNFLGAIRFALTGENPNVGTKAENIAQLSNPTEVSRVKFSFTHNSVLAEVTRTLRPENEKSELTISGDGLRTETVRGDRKVNELIFQLLGIDAKTINEIVIVAQKDIFGFMSQRLAERADIFQRLFRTDQAAVVEKLLGKRINAIEIPATYTDIDVVQTQIASRRESIVEIEASLSELPNVEEMEEAHKVDHEIDNQWQERVRLEGALVAHNERLLTRQQQRADAELARDNVQDNLDTLLSARDGNADAVVEATLALAQLKTAKQLEQQYLTHKQQRDMLQGYIDNSPAPARPAFYRSDYDVIEASLASLNAGIQFERQFQATFKDGKSQCPTCHSAVDSLTDRLEQSKQTIAAHLKSATALNTVLSESRAYDTNAKIHENQTAGWQESLKQHNEQIKKLAGSEIPNTPAAELELVISNQDDYNHAIKEYEPVLRDRERALAASLGNIESLTATILETESLMNEITVTEQDATAARDRLQRRAGDLRYANELRSRLAVDTAHLARDEQQLAELQSTLADIRMKRSWLDWLEERRALVHRDAAPRFVAQRNLQRLQGGMNEYLTMFDASWRVRAMDGLTFNCHFTDGRIQPAQRLSGGEEVITALAWRFALNAMLVSDIGLLALDEPTAYLDSHHIRGFEPTLNRLHTYAQSRGLQCIIITHEEELAPLFDQVISL